MADFLGDPKFPAKSMHANRAMRIAYVHGIFRQYSRLQLTASSDRPIAIAGLESRLHRTFNMKRGVGIFDDGPGGELFHRSILWQRGEEVDPRDFMRTDFRNRSSSVPSWSWMAYEGGIDYVDPPFASAHWLDEIILPLEWPQYGIGVSSSLYTSEELFLTATIRPLTVADSL
ncbi:hypothetical protein CC86DRAFT_426448 [Ophiobolus disseminans]|uniref:Heterokaryon incompatibility domain-containing protein n=1 Tax=Ophiobolus disseminans TaxID=1469910 RepID=A0A6A6ZLS0_9PLEO|nr:hypothetical protein CC86DRAFT_426448 [Ophiobolus disseminans]